MNGNDVLGRELHACIVGGNLGIVPLGDVPKEDGCQRFARELEFRRLEARDVVGRNNRAEGHGDVQDFAPLGFLQLGVGHRAVGRTKVGSLITDCLDAPTGTDRLVVDLDLGELVVFVEILGVERGREGGACAGQGLGFAFEWAGDCHCARRGACSGRRGCSCRGRSRRRGLGRFCLGSSGGRRWGFGRFSFATASGE